MKRAAVLIGVDKTGNLPILQDAALGARRMEAWARSQNMASVDVFTDEGATGVDIGAIKRAIRAIVDSGTFDQLVIYFAGHGVNIRYGEYWLLTDAPRDAQAAVNVRGSADLASYCGIPHVVLISDACRTAAQGIQAQNVSGSEIFPNDPPSGTEQPVDRFFACTLGRPSYEIQDPVVTAGEFHALYTDTALPALTGTKLELCDRVTGSPSCLLRPRRFKEYLAAEVSQRIKGLHLQTEVIQVPDAHISSDDNAWIAGFDIMAAAPPPAPGPPPPAPTLAAPALSAELVRSVIANPSQAKTILESPRLTALAGVTGNLIRAAEPFGPSHHETECGFKIRGARFLDVYSAKSQPAIAGSDDIRVSSINNNPGASVLLNLDGTRCVVLPAIPGFLGALTVEDGELVDVAYEPSDNNWRWGEFNNRSQEIRALRAIAASATRNGVFRLEGEDAMAVAKRMQYSKGVDPALAIYAAYGYEGINRRDPIREMSRFMMDDLRGRFFDIALLAKELTGKQSGRDPTVFSFVPLLAQGWALLSANRVSLPPELIGLERFLVPSVWTMFDGTVWPMIQQALSMGAIL